MHMGYSGENMTIEERLNQLEDAHRALAAQHTALLETCKYMLPLINADPGVMRTTLLALYDGSNQHMSHAGHDAEFQRGVREWLDVLSAAILAVEDKRDRPRNSTAPAP